jgi:hypothetical protein
MVERMEIKDLLDAYVICRTLGHSWDEHPNPEYSEALFRTSQGALALRCSRCLAERYDYIDKRMDVAARQYKYPPHYTTIPGEGTRPNLRGEMFRRSLLFQSYKRRNGR